jgi:hypothetical protein
LIGPGESTAITLSSAGTFAYTCTPHPWMKGSVIVLAAAAAPAAQAPPPTFTPVPAAPPPAAAPPAAQVAPTPTPFRFLTATPVTGATSTTTAPRAGGIPLELAVPLLAGGASALSGGVYLLRRRRHPPQT